ncbi:hypothetical protein [Litoribaculum gwangyangense]|uniref:Carboxypeptidase-like regulatory domain-containing protein n=1 Tax=Litoribaculum gwangyangense TaxID=1130722 RepID=A0ABP9CNK3_9FLAO
MSSTNDVEAITIFNKSSNKGTITDEKGLFVLKVALNDIIEISALQFQTVTITIDDEVIKSKQLKIQLIEQVNYLDAVTLSSGLSGNLQTDIQNTKVMKLKPIDLGNMNAFEMSEDKVFSKGVIQDHLISIIHPDERNYLPDFVKIFKLLKKSKPRTSLNNDGNIERLKPTKLLDIYSHKEISGTFNIPQENVESFLVFIENNGIKPELLKPENELQLIEFLIRQKEEFLNLEDAKN